MLYLKIEFIFTSVFSTLTFTFFDFEISSIGFRVLYNVYIYFIKKKNMQHGFYKQKFKYFENE